MAWVEIISGPDQGRTMELKPGWHTVGRQPDCDVTLNDVKVSRLHARLDVELNRVVIWDKSTNGTYVQEKRIQAATNLYPGDVIRLGDTLIRLRMEPKGLDLSGGGQYLPVGGATRSLQLQAETITIGRDPSNSITIAHPSVSRFHARINGKAGRCFLEDLNSVNGTYVNGERINGSVELHKKSLVQIGGNSYYFDGYTLDEYQDSEGQVTIEVSNLCKAIRLPDGKNRVLLNNIDLVIEPQQFVAILGGSGAGKTTLLGALTGMKPATDGQILINGRDFYQEYDVFRSLIGYVPQDDIVHMDLTVREVLTYSARLRMPDDTSEFEITAAVSRVINDLDLTERADVLVRNLSGGQRKRVSIGVELLTSPSLLFLDEPTSGLDPGLEKVMMEMFRRLADQGQSVFLVTHATINVHLCDKVIFLTEGGELAFYGSPNQAQAYFGSNDFADIYRKLTTEKSPQQWASSFRRSPEFQKNVVNKQTAAHRGGPSPITGPIGTISPNQSNSSSVKQWSILSSRYALIMTRDTRNMLLLFLQPLIIGLLIVMVFYNNGPLFKYSEYKVGDTQITAHADPKAQERSAGETERRSRMSICVAVMVFTAIWLGTSNSAREIVKEKAIYRRERLVNLKVSPYLMSKVFILFIICLLQTFIFLGIIRLGIGLPKFWSNAGAFLLISFASVMMGLVVSVAVGNADKAVSAVPILLVPQIILSGAIVPISSVEPEVLRYIFYPAISKWGYELVGGGILNINSRVSLKTNLEALEGDFTGHWWIIAGFVVAFYLICTLVLTRPDNES